MELGTIVGIILGVIALATGVILGVEGDMALITEAFLDFPSLIIVIGGALGGTFISFPMDVVLTSLKAIGQVFKALNMNPQGAITEIIELANLARREGILALEEKANNMEDAFLKKGIGLIVDGTDPELVRSILETEMSYIEQRHKNISGVWGFIASALPAWGMLGTFIGLVLMLLSLDDPDTLGPAMAVALVTTLYGALFANFLATPIENKLKYFNSEEMVLKEILIEGMLSVQAGENPRIIEEKLKSFLSPTIREQMSGGTNQGGE